MTRNRKIPYILGIVGFIGGLIGMLGWHAARAHSAATATKLDSRYVYQVSVGSSPANGPADALVTVVQFSTYGCGACRAVDRLTKELAGAHPGDVRLVWKDVPTPGARDAARTARAAMNQNRFWQVHDRLMSRLFLTESRINADIGDSGTDLVRLKNDLTATSVDMEILQDQQLASALDLHMVPAIFINGKYIPEVTAQSLEKAYQEAHVAAEILVAGGISRSQVYSSMMRGAITSAKDFHPGPTEVEHQVGQMMKAFQ